MSAKKSVTTGKASEKQGRKLVIKNDPIVESEIPLNQLATVHVLLSNTIEVSGGWVKAEIGLTVPCKVKEINQVYPKVVAEVEKKLAKQVSEMTNVGAVVY